MLLYTIANENLIQFNNTFLDCHVDYVSFEEEHIYD